ncbi:DegV family protein [Acholeplasma vituli]|uniref:DegV family protein n=1 Tax=Paracholeplasma vituli TaxID=69473 RepID=A0ABT2Q003_9MOLU|nr:DegV family protein [Paracholeplasma vituli]MCU0105317.1 DegV family protein [Paracholeplasma vituli]
MNKLKLGVVVDSTFNLKESFIKTHDIRVVYLDIMVGTETYRDGDLTNEQIYAFVDQNKKVSTSQPAPNRFMIAYQSLLDEGYEHVVCLTVSQSLSGTFNSALLAKDMLEHKELVTVLDTKSAICGAEYLVERLVEKIETEHSIEKVIEGIHNDISHGSLIFTVDDLNILVKSGRLSKIQGMIGNLLKIKPILRFDQGKLSVEHKVRSTDGILTYLTNEVSKLRDKAKTVVRITYTTTSDVANQFCEIIKTKFDDVSVKVSGTISAVIAVHVGKAGLGIYLTNE